jgi:CDGSH-type Zn-finger protein
MKEKRMVGIIKGNGAPIVGVKIGRNALCKCGSGKKQKRCCGAETKYYASVPDDVAKERMEKKKEKENS